MQKQTGIAHTVENHFIKNPKGLWGPSKSQGMKKKDRGHFRSVRRFKKWTEGWLGKVGQVSQFLRIFNPQIIVIGCFDYNFDEVIFCFF